MVYDILTFTGEKVLKINEIMTKKQGELRSKAFKFGGSSENSKTGEWIEYYSIRGVDVSFIYNKSTSQLKIYLLSNFSSDRANAISELEKLLELKLTNN